MEILYKYRQIYELQYLVKNKGDSFQNVLKKIYSIQSPQQVFKIFQQYYKQKQIAQARSHSFFQFLMRHRAITSGKSVTINHQSKVQTALSELQTLCQQFDDDTEYQQCKIKIKDTMILDQIIEILNPIIGKNKAKVKGPTIFKQLGKDKIKVDRIEYFLKKLRQNKLDPGNVTKIQHLIAGGKKKAIMRIIIERLGQIRGNQIFVEFQKDIPQKLACPIEGSTPIRQEKGLKIYSYQQTISQYQKLNAQTMMVFGQTGCGKSTFLNAICNYIAGVQLEDYFRYNIIVEDVAHQKESITSTISDYYIKDKLTNIVYRLIDTPGFGDTRGYYMDQMLIKMVGQKFNEDIDVIHNILFVIKSSDTRITQYHKYIFQSIMDLFNKDIAPNFVFIFTFSDQKQPQVLQSVKCPNFGFGKYWTQIQDPKYLSVNNSGIFEKYQPGNKMVIQFWKKGMNCMSDLFKKVNSIEAKSLKLSKDLINKKQALANKIRYTFETLQRATSKRQNIKVEIQKIMQYSQLIDSNKDYTFQVPVDVWCSQHIDQNVTRCVNCANSNCHIRCSYGDGQDKSKCIAFKDSLCTVCPKKCDWRSHKNEKYIMVTKKVNQTRTRQDYKQKFDQNISKKSGSQVLLLGLLKDLQDQMQSIIEYAKEMNNLQQELAKNQMSNCKPQSTIGYLNFLINNLEKTQQIGYQRRIQSYNEAINQMKVMEELHNGNLNQKYVIQKLNVQNFQNIAKDIKNPIIVERFTKIIESLSK